MLNDDPVWCYYDDIISDSSTDRPFLSLEDLWDKVVDLETTSELDGAQMSSPQLVAIS